MTNQNQHSDAIDLVQLAKVLLKKKWLIIMGTLLLTIAAGIVAFLLPKTYKSEGFLQLSPGMELDVQTLREMQYKLINDLANNFITSTTMQRNRMLNESLRNSTTMLLNVSIPDFRKLNAQFTNLQDFNAYLKQNITEKSLLIKLKQTFNSSEELAECIEPVHAYSKNDMKELIKTSRDLKNYILGVDLTCEQSTPENAQKTVSLLGDFIKDRLIRGKLEYYVEEQLSLHKAQYKKSEVNILQNEFQLRQLNEKRDRVTTMIKNYPSGGNNANRELFSLADSGHRYLSPVTQMVGIEAYIADIMENLALQRRIKEMMIFKIAVLEELQRQMKTTPKITELLLQTDSLLNRLMMEKTDLPEDSRQQAMNELGMELEDFTILEKNILFSPTPTLPHRPSAPRKGVIIVVAFVFGFFLCIVLAFVHDWWQNNKKKLAD